MPRALSSWKSPAPAGCGGDCRGRRASEVKLANETASCGPVVPEPALAKLAPPRRPPTPLQLRATAPPVEHPVGARACGNRRSYSWKGRGPSAVYSTPPGAVPKYPDPGQQGNDLSRSRGGRIRSGAGLFPSGFPNPPTTCLNFSLWRDLSFLRIWGGYFGHRRSGWEGFIDSGDAVPVAV